MAEEVWDYNIVQLFITGRATTMFPLMAERVKLFIDNMSPVLHRAEVALTAYWDTPYGKLKYEKAVESLRRDLAQAKEGLGVYNRVIKDIEVFLMLMDAQYDFPKFLEQNGCPPHLVIPTIQALSEDVHNAWQRSYAPLIDHFKRIRDKIILLHGLLDEQVMLLQRLETTSYLDGFKVSAQLQSLFKKEIETFRELVLITPLSRKEVSLFKGVLATQRFLLKERIDAYVYVLRLAADIDAKVIAGELPRSESEKANAEVTKKKKLALRALLAFVWASGLANAILKVIETLYTKGMDLAIDKALTIIGVKRDELSPEYQEGIKQLADLLKSTIKDKLHIDRIDKMASHFLYT